MHRDSVRAIGVLDGRSRSAAYRCRGPVDDEHLAIAEAPMGDPGGPIVLGKAAAGVRFRMVGRVDMRDEHRRQGSRPLHHDSRSCS
jgi:hypothetical protein